MANEKRLIYSNDVWGEANKVKFMGFCVEERKKSFLDLISAMLDNAPTVDAMEVVHAKWIYQDGEHICSHCKATILYELDNQGDAIGEDWPWCARCGAKMDGGDEDAEAARVDKSHI